MMIHNKLLMLLSLSLVVWSCCKEECSSGDLTISFEKFAIRETDTIAYIKYNPGTNLAQAIDTAWEYRPSSSPTDTGRSITYKTLFFNWEWRIYVPALNKTYDFTAFETVRDKCSCSNKKREIVKRFKVNNTLKEGQYLVLDK